MLPSPADFGWSRNSYQVQEPLWTALSEASASYQELVLCKCKVGGRDACKCFRSALPCTALCAGNALNFVLMPPYFYCFSLQAYKT